MNKNLLNFSVQVYGELQEYNPTISIGRCRIFYKGLNRNGSFINDTFAEKLLNSLPYTPVKGIYVPENADYSTHGSENSQGRIYGIVPENPNMTWEVHMDEDGVSRTYACCDVYIFTALYEEARDILSKPESMELYPPSIKGEWTYIEGQKVFEFTDGCFFGLQVLGDEVEPCFEGAAFFTLSDKMEQAFEKLKKLESTFELNDIGGKVEMHEMNFKLSDGQIYQELFALLNPQFAETGEVKYGICEVSDEYALVRNYEEGTYEKVKYAIEADEEEVVVEETEPTSEETEETTEVTEATEEAIEETTEEVVEEAAEQTTEEVVEEVADHTCVDKKKKYVLQESAVCYMISVTETEKVSLESVQQLNGGTFEKIDEVFAKVPELESKVSEIENKNSDFEQNIAEKDSEISTLKAENESFTLKVSELEASLETANNSLEELVSYKLSIEKAEKQAIIDKYSEKLGAETMSKYTAETELNKVELEKELAFELVNASPSLFSNEADDGYVPTETPLTGIEAILSKYKK